MGQLTAVGVNVFVEYGAGMGVGFFDAEYLEIVQTDTGTSRDARGA